MFRRPPSAAWYGCLRSGSASLCSSALANRLTLTAHGRTYQVGLSPIFDALAQLTDQVQAQAGSRILTIGVGPTFAIRWLIPRLESFR